MKPFADSGIKNTNAYDNTMFIFIYLFILSLMLTIIEQILFIIKNSNKVLIDVNTLVKKPIEHETLYIKKHKR